jgi:acetylornithine/succinyldiaminopimelate/putrescine aminotransferase
MAVTRKTGSQTDAKPSTVDMTGKEFYLAKRVAGGFAIAALGEKVAGVIEEGKNVGLHTSITTGNQLKAVAGAAIAVGDKLSSDANGKVRVAASTHWVFGTASSVAANGELVEFDMDQEGVMA